MNIPVPLPVDLTTDAELKQQLNPEWSEAQIRQAVPFSALPESLRVKLGDRRAAINSDSQQNKPLAL